MDGVQRERKMTTEKNEMRWKKIIIREWEREGEKESSQQQKHEEIILSTYNTHFGTLCLCCAAVKSSTVEKNCSVNFVFFLRSSDSIHLFFSASYFIVPFLLSLCLTLRISDSLFSSPVQHSSVQQSIYRPLRGTSTHVCIFSEVFLTPPELLLVACWSPVASRRWRWFLVALCAPFLRQ